MVFESGVKTERKVFVRATGFQLVSDDTDAYLAKTGKGRGLTGRILKYEGGTWSENLDVIKAGLKTGAVVLHEGHQITEADVTYVEGLNKLTAAAESEAAVEKLLEDVGATVAEPIKKKGRKA